MQCKAHGAQNPRQYKEYGKGASTAQRRRATKEKPMAPPQPLMQDFRNDATRAIN